MKDTERLGRDTSKRNTWLGGAVNLAKPPGNAERAYKAALPCSPPTVTLVQLKGPCVLNKKCWTVSKDSVKKFKNCHLTKQLQRRKTKKIDLLIICKCGGFSQPLTNPNILW